MGMLPLNRFDGLADSAQLLHLWFGDAEVRTDDLGFLLECADVKSDHPTAPDDVRRIPHNGVCAVGSIASRP